MYELFVNGDRIGDLELTPGFTAYRSRLQVQPYDVGGALGPGANAVEILLSDGWFRGRHGFERAADGFGDRTAALLAIEVALQDGRSMTVTTGPGWWSRPGHVVAADLMDGQRTDLRLTGAASLDEPGWSPARPVSHGLYARRDRLLLTEAPPVRSVAELRPVRVARLDAETVVADFGHNINGRVRLSGLGPRGTEITLRHGEHLDADGRLDTEHLRAFVFTTGERLPAGQIDSVVSAGRPEDVFEPRHTTHGFRYVEIHGHPGPLGADDVTAVEVRSDLAATGRFACDDARLEALHQAAVRSFQANACDIPTDCPQRERAGWSGDWQVYVQAAALTHDVAGFGAKWLRDLAADQWPDGTVPNYSPNPSGPGPVAGSFSDTLHGSAGWGDAAVLVPWELWRAYGDLDLLERQYDSMRRWVERAATAAREGRHPARAAARPRPAPHERYLWDTGAHFGEWLEPGVEPALGDGTDHGAVATAYLAHSADRLGRVAGLLGRTADEERYARLAHAARDAWQREFLTPDGDLVIDTQATHVRALAFRLVPGELRDRVAGRLAALVEAAGHRVGTGFLSTGLLLPALADTGHLDAAYRVLLSTGVPSWLEMLDRGATTIWEWWDGVQDGRARGSLNHYSKGAVVSFLYTHVAGLRLPECPGLDEAGYRRFIVQPRPGGSLTWARAEHRSPYGPIRCHWRLEREALELTVDVPPGTQAEIRLPGGQVLYRTAGRHRVRARALPTSEPD
ncbi:family 78 glycoside hydrolase catalytic domain [Thermocatellispora tengchongensis]|uniref:family 78 glycoside hydrolase catalytic domain n=1 Tax=Thermocatellispora tengchongensis TaxID=1073253 RepID=UPI003644EBF6